MSKMTATEDEELERHILEVLAKHPGLKKGEIEAKIPTEFRDASRRARSYLDRMGERAGRKSEGYRPTFELRRRLKVLRDDKKMIVMEGTGNSARYWLRSARS